MLACAASGCWKLKVLDSELLCVVSGSQARESSAKILQNKNQGNRFFGIRQLRGLLYQDERELGQRWLGELWLSARFCLSDKRMKKYPRYFHLRL